MAMILLAIALISVLLALRAWAVPLLPSILTSPYDVVAMQAIDFFLVLGAAALADRLLRLFYWQKYLQQQRGHEAPALLRDLATLLIFTVAISVWLHVELGVGASGLIAASSATAVVIGLALQTMILDLFSGLSVNFDRSFVIGDWLTVHSQELPGPVYGRVEGMTWRTTSLRLEDGTCTVIPNRLMTANPVTNHTSPQTPKRLAVDVSIDIREPSERVLRLLLGEALKAVRMAGLSPSPEPTVVHSKIIDDSAFYTIRFYADPNRITPTDACSIMTRALQDGIRVHRLTLPFQRVEIVPVDPEMRLDRAREMRDALQRNPLFAQVLSLEQIASLAENCRPLSLAPGSPIIRQGDEGSSMFIILDGAARVSVSSGASDEREVAVLASGDFLGEMSLLTGAPRAATVTALTSLNALEITKTTMEAVFANAPDLLEKFGAVLAQRQTKLDNVASGSHDTASVEQDLIARMRSFFSRKFSLAPRR